jgi:hypothetical protein
MTERKGASTLSQPEIERMTHPGSVIPVGREREINTIVEEPLRVFLTERFVSHSEKCGYDLPTFFVRGVPGIGIDTFLNMTAQKLRLLKIPVTTVDYSKELLPSDAEGSRVLIIHNFDQAYTFNQPMKNGKLKYVDEMMSLKHLMEDGEHLVIIGGVDLHSDFPREMMGKIKEVELGPFNLPTTMEYFKRNHPTLSKDIAKLVYEFTSGHPMAIRIAAEALSKDKTGKDSKNIIAKALGVVFIPYIFNKEPDITGTFVGASVMRTFDSIIVSEVIDSKEGQLVE